MSSTMETSTHVEVNKSRLSTCEVCNKSDAIYTCPKCDVKTCSLDCVKIHKKELDCDGIRDRTKFVSLKEFSSSDFYSDYVFLEECSRFVYGKQRNIAKRYTQIDKPLPHYLNRLKRMARERGTVLLILPEHFALRKTNTSRVRGREILWRVDWIFGDVLVPNSGPPVSESTRLGQVLQEVLDKEEESHITCYRAAGVPNLRLFLKAERVKGCSGKYYELDAGLSLADNLRGKCLLEYPAVRVMLRDHAYALDIVHSDDEQDLEDEPGSQAPSTTAAPPTAGGEQLAKRPRRELATEKVARQEREKVRSEVELQRKRAPKNLLFVTGYSDEDSDSGAEV